MQTKILILMVFLTIASGKHLHKESYYQNKWCKAQGGKMEYRLEDRTRVDCLTDEYAVEFDFASKWAEAIGQSLYYGIMTDRKPAVALIMENPKRDKKYFDRLKRVADRFCIKLIPIVLIEVEK